MKNTILLFIFSVLLLSSCGVNRARNNVKVGKWVTIDTLNSDVYKNIEYYKKGQPVRKWRNYKNETLVKSEKYKGNTSTIKFYNEAKKVIATGKSKLDETNEFAHWYYDGDWFYYDDSGKLIQTKSYYNGVMMYQNKKE